jgi:hypothetical protein
MNYVSSETIDAVKWLNYTNVLTSARAGITYEDAGHYIIPLVKLTSSSSDADESIWAWDMTMTGSDYNGILKLPRIRLNTPNVSSEYATVTPNGSGISYSSKNEDGTYNDMLELSDISLPVRTEKWSPSTTIKPDSYDIDAYAANANSSDLHIRLTDNDGVVSIINADVTKDEEKGTTDISYDSSKGIDIKKAFVRATGTGVDSSANAKEVFGSTAVLAIDARGEVDEDTNVRTYTDTVTLKDADNNSYVIAKRVHTNNDAGYKYTYFVPGTETVLEDSYTSNASEDLYYRITQTVELSISVDADGNVTEYELVHPDTDAVSAGEPLTFTVGEEELSTKIRTALFASYTEIDVTAAIHDSKNEQYVSSLPSKKVLW